MMQLLENRTMARLYGNVDGEEYEGAMVALDVERPEGEDEVALHLFIDGTGSHVSYYLNRDTALDLAAKLLLAARTR